MEAFVKATCRGGYEKMKMMKRNGLFAHRCLKLQLNEEQAEERTVYKIRVRKKTLLSASNSLDRIFFEK